jgi:hypothetical protein
MASTARQARNCRRSIIRSPRPPRGRHTPHRGQHLTACPESGCLHSRRGRSESTRLRTSPEGGVRPDFRAGRGGVRVDVRRRHAVAEQAHELHRVDVGAALEAPANDPSGHGDKAPFGGPEPGPNGRAVRLPAADNPGRHAR